jgi:hypothetical protein
MMNGADIWYMQVSSKLALDDSSKFRARRALAPDCFLLG